jgi:hypothetical protein
LLLYKCALRQTQDKLATEADEFVKFTTKNFIEKQDEIAARFYAKIHDQDVYRFRWW